MTSLSIVVPTYQRRNLVGHALDSAIAWLDRLGVGEIVVVDDASSDGTFDYLSQHYRDELDAGRIVLRRLHTNAGVTGAKNAGVAIARNDWIVFLDSDDRLIAEAARPVAEELKRCKEPLVFYRCLDLATGVLIGDAPAERAQIELRTLLSCWRWGECLPVVRREAIQAFPYSAELRGYEGIAYARIVSASGPARMSDIVARRYDAGNHARETNASRMSRWRRHRQYTAIMLREFRGALSLRTATWYALSFLRANFDGLRSAMSARG